MPVHRTPPDGVVDRALGCLHGLAIGDALGMPTQLLARSDVVARYGDLVEWFHPGPPDHPIAAGRPAGSVTDDTEQALLVGRLLVAGGGHIAPEELAAALVAWEEGMRARGSADLLGPSTTAAVAALRAGSAPEVAGRNGATNGAAMRIAPVGLAVAAGSDGGWDGLVDRVVEVSTPTHGTGLALAGAAAVAAAVSAGVAGGPSGGTTTLPVQAAAALAAARGAAPRGRWVAGGEVASRLGWAMEVVGNRRGGAAAGLIASLVGTSLAAQESVPAAFAVLAAAGDDPWLAVRLAASVGGDTDTIAAMVGAVAGARFGMAAWPDPAVAVIDRLDLDLGGLVDGLLALRRS